MFVHKLLAFGLSAAVLRASGGGPGEFQAVVFVWSFVDIGADGQPINQKEWSDA